METTRSADGTVIAYDRAGNGPDWFHQTVETTTGAIPGARLVMLEGQDHGAPPEVLAPVLTGFFLGSLGR